MAVTRSRAAERPEIKRDPRGPRTEWKFRAGPWRVRELAAILCAGALIAAGLWTVYQSKAPELDAAAKQLAAKQLVDLNDLGAREDVLPTLGVIASQKDREEAARRIYDASGHLPNVGAVRRAMSGDAFKNWKPLVVVRRPQEFAAAFRLWTLAFFAAFFAAHAWLSLRRSKADQTLLPATLLLSGLGMILMVSLRDPLRDQMLFADFAQGAAGGCLLLAAASGIDYVRHFGRLSYTPLLASFALSVLLVLFGHGPGTSDAKVNLFGFQPVEIIRILLIFFLAGYFAARWDVLRHARETRAKVARFVGRLDVPPVEYTLPAAACVGLSLLFFFLQKDMGPALVFACVFLLLYGLARGSVFVPALGLAVVTLGFVAGYFIGIPHTVGERVAMWLSPWNNLVHGGDQLADSLWAFATGGVSGLGVGRGDPQLVPAAHTDLILAAVGEELGFLGVAAVFALYGWIVWRALRAALRAATDYEFFLAAGLAAATALEILLIAGGALGVVPLSGVVTPFLSYGRTSMFANFAIIGILLSISGRSEPVEAGHARSVPVFRAPVAFAAILLAAAGAVELAKAGYIQVARSAAIMGQGTLVVQADGARRYQYNPRFQEVMREIPKGTIYDRNGLPLATSDWDQLEKHRAQYRQLGIDIDAACPKNESRHYPFGSLMFDLLGDLRTRMRWAASNTSFIERDSARRLRGYDERPEMVQVKNPSTGKMERVVRYDYRELVPLVRHRFDPQNPAVRKILDRPRDVHTSIDARLQVRVAEILRRALQAAHQDKGAAVVMDPATGDLLASVSFPLPPEVHETAPDQTFPPASAPEPAPDAANPYLDRARYGLYPPGSTFKIVTAMAALRKDPHLTQQTYACVRLPDGRAGAYVKGWDRPIRDDIQDKEPHGTVNMERGIVVSCNAYFAQLGTYNVGAQPLFDVAGALGIQAASPNTAAQLKRWLPVSAYGQGQVVASPFQMARVAATVANGGAMPQGRWITDETNLRTSAPQPVLPADQARTLAKFMREVVTSGTGRAAAANAPVAGKTGTAELADAPSHAWFIGFAPYGGTKKQIAFSVLVEHGVYGGTAAAPAAAGIVNAALQLGLIQP
ncbi:MAG TPA: FtsW/RodA/SpoVE family cell cycle protein [Bryobacteraceae bacterium]|nr:FtsW/RodA/SpoVE family cell cycle protein [Bryobacteraceae bacterium]